MKILVVCTVPTEKSGIPNVIFNLLQSIDRSNLSIGYVSINYPDESFRIQLERIGVNLYVIPRQLKNPLSYVKSLYTVCRNYDIIHVHGNSATMVLEMISAKIAGVKLRISHCHSTSCNNKLIDRLARPLFHTLCNGRLACGRDAGKWLYRNQNYAVISNGIVTDRFRYSKSVRSIVRCIFDINDNTENNNGLTGTIIGHIGNFVEVKNHKFLLNLFAIYHAKNKNSKLLLLGAGPLKNEIIKQVNYLGIEDKVIIAGSVDNPEDYMNAMDIVVMPSLYEGLPLTLIEEQANGLKIIASDTISPDSNVTGQITFLSLNDDIRIWTNTIDKLISEQTDRQTQSDIAIKKIKEAGYDIHEVSQKLKDFYYQQMPKD